MPTASHTSDSSVIRASVAKFRLAWAIGQRPRIDDYLASAHDADQRRELLTALVAVDLEQRWQLATSKYSSTTVSHHIAPPEAAGAEPLPLSDYLVRYPELRTGELPLELLEVAFRCLHARDGSASVEEFLREYDLPPARQAALTQRLSRLGTATTSSGGDASRTLSFVRGDAARPVVQPGFEKMKLSFGPYKVIGLIGSGGYGAVFLGHDERLDRLVAIKVAHTASEGGDNEQNELHRSFIAEARRIAQLNHPHIVKVLDVDRKDSCAWYLVMEYIDGPSFKDATVAGKLTPLQIATILAQVARGVHHAHRHDIFHRDLKPSNILLNAQQWPYVVDFGMALHVRDQRSQAGRVMGTPAYMSPEQVRGESHRLDGRADVWSLGVTLYEALTGQRPFGGEGPEDLFDEILHKEARPLRQLNDDVPAELDRICLRCLAKRMRDRYATAADLADDLEHWVATQSKTAADMPIVATAPVTEPVTPPPAPPQRPRVIPRGLRSFGERDADFFIDLLPGPFARDGLPESIHRWRSAIESPESPDQAVCVLYGPSGSGKSSIVRAGILPQLSARVHCILVDAGCGDVEASLLAALLRMHPDLPTGARLPEACAWLRRRLSSGGGGKVLLVIDQFEHWLHASGARDSESLVAALRHCDGTHLQCLITVRTDFWLGVTRFMEQLDAPLVDEVNCGRIDLFPQRHAIKVLKYFGEAYGCLPEGDAPLAPSQQQFLEKAIEQIADDGWIVPVRLALLAEMLKSRDWQPETLHSLGGEKGLGVQFLDQTFDSAFASPAHRRHRRTVEAVLGELLPEEGLEIKGQSRARDQLIRAAGLTGQDDQFDAAIDVLDRQLRLITPVDQHAALEDGGAPPPSAQPAEPSPAYQLTHDYLVPAIREWLTRRRQQTRGGRAQLCLERRARQWAPTREARYLPSFAESVRIAAFTRRSNWTPDQRSMMRRAAFWHSEVLLGALAIVVGLALIVFQRPASRLAGFFDSSRPAAQRLEHLEAVPDPTPNELKSAILVLDREQHDEVLTAGAEWLTRLVRPPTDDSRTLTDYELSLIRDFALRRLAGAGPDDGQVTETVRSTLFDVLAQVARVGNAGVFRPIVDSLARLQLPTDGEARRNLVISLKGFMNADVPMPVRVAATGCLAPLAADELLRLFVDAFAESTKYAGTSLADYLASLPPGDAERRSQDLVDSMQQSLESLLAMTDDELLLVSTEPTYLLMSLSACQPYLAARPDAVVEQLGALLQRRGQLSDPALIELGCLVLAELYVLPADESDAAVERSRQQVHEILADSQLKEPVRASAAKALGIIGDEAAVRSLAQPASDYQRSRLQLAAVDALVKIHKSRERQGIDASDVLAAFRPLFNVENHHFDGDEDLLRSLREIVDRFCSFAPVQEYAMVLPAAMKLRQLPDARVQAWNAYATFLARHPGSAFELTEAYLTELLGLPNNCVPSHGETIVYLLELTPEGFDSQEIMQLAITAAKRISLEHPTDDLGALARENIEIAIR